MRTLLLAAAALLALAPAAARADDAAALMAKHQAFTGWSSSDSSMATLRATGTRRHGGAVDAFTEVRRGLLFHDTVATPQGITDESGFGGRYIWRSDENHYWAVQLGRTAQAQIAWDIVSGEAVAQFHPTLAGTAAVGGRQTEILQIQPQGLVPIDIYEDPSSGAFVRVVVAPGNEQRVYDDMTYAQIPGNRRAVAGWRQGDIRYRLTSFDPGAAVSDADLQPAPPAPSWTFGEAPLDLTTVGDNQHYVRVAASVNGRTGIFLLSTETPSIVLYDDFARQAGVQDLGTADFSPYLGNPQFAGYARASTIQAGSAVLHNVIVQRIVSPDNRLAGVLGYDFLAGAVFDVNLAAGRMRVLDPAANEGKPGKGGYAFPIDLTGRTPRIALSLPQGIAQPTLATGLSGFMMLSQALRDSGRISGHDVSSQADVGFGGWGATGDPIASAGMRSTYTSWNDTTTSGACMTSDRMMIGPYTYENPEICLGGTNVFGADGGLIGLDFLRHFNWIVDYPHGRFIVTPNGQ